MSQHLFKQLKQVTMRENQYFITHQGQEVEVNGTWEGKEYKVETVHTLEDRDITTDLAVDDIVSITNNISYE